MSINTTMTTMPVSVPEPGPAVKRHDIVSAKIHHAERLEAHRAKADIHADKTAARIQHHDRINSDYAHLASIAHKRMHAAEHAGANALQRATALSEKIETVSSAKLAHLSDKAEHMSARLDSLRQIAVQKGGDTTQLDALSDKVDAHMAHAVNKVERHSEKMLDMIHNRASQAYELLQKSRAMAQAHTSPS